MEKSSLHELQFFLEEDLFLLPEDKKAYKIQSPTSENISDSKDKVMEAKATYHQEVAPVIPEEDLVPIAVKGNFTNGLLVVHEEEDLSEEVMNMLVKMINAVGRSMNEIGLVSSANLENRSLEEFEALNAHIILKFGRIKHPINSVPAISYEVYTDRETQYLFADPLSQISVDNTMKRKLWNALQVLFNIKK